MLFNSLDFAIFFPIVFILYWLLFSDSVKSQNIFILSVSYFFYGWWDPKFLILIFTSSLIDFLIGKFLYKKKFYNYKKILLLLSISANLGFLGFFKYYNFFVENFIDAFSIFGQEISLSTLNIILPVGISFYTFQTLSYTIDIYKNKVKPTDNIISFFAFVSFFPQLVAGPIERAKNLLPQFYVKRKFNNVESKDGLRQILWGLFKKIVIADNCGEISDLIFNSPTVDGGLSIILGAFFFSFQIYCDFSGYSDIAIGSARLLGFNLMKNFAFPYFSRDIAEFWRRWHISLSTWFRDYVYIPLGGSRVNNYLKVRNVFAIFLISGFWHGANWTFIFWGFLNALYFIPLILSKKNRSNLDVIANGKLIPNFNEFVMMLLTFTLVMLTWIFFRSENVSVALSYFEYIFSYKLFHHSFLLENSKTFEVFVLVLVFVIIEWIGRNNEYAIEKISIFNVSFRWISYVILILSLFIFTGKQQQFIYFQF